MTPAQMHNNVFLLGTVGGAFVLETLALLVAPRLLAFAALVPVSSRRIALDAAARARLSTRDERASYRRAGLADLDWHRLPGPRRFVLLGAPAELDARAARVVLRLPWEPRWFAFTGVTVVGLRVEGDSVVFTARALPWLTFTSAAFFGALLALVGPGEPGRVGAVFVGLFAVFSALSAWRIRRSAAPFAEAVAALVAQRCHAPG